MHHGIDWMAYCKHYGLNKEDLFKIASDIGLPFAKLTDSQSQTLLQELEKHSKQKDATEVRQTSLF